MSKGQQFQTLVRNSQTGCGEYVQLSSFLSSMQGQNHCPLFLTFIIYLRVVTFFSLFGGVEKKIGRRSAHVLEWEKSNKQLHTSLGHTKIRSLSLKHIFFLGRTFPVGSKAIFFFAFFHHQIRTCGYFQTHKHSEGGVLMPFLCHFFNNGDQKYQQSRQAPLSLHASCVKTTFILSAGAKCSPKIFHRWGQNEFPGYDSKVRLLKLQRAS